jgi:phosphopantothenoylcysteine decarboxylase / phosphopantothenate---cysteine ligase
MSRPDRRSVLLIVGGGIAAYKTLELVRLLKKADIGVTPILTRSGAEFVTPLSLGVLAGEKVRQDLFSQADEAEIDHIALSRAADLVVVAPATADLIARAAHGHANDLASTVLLATDKPVLMAPAMNVRMWTHAAVRRNVAQLTDDGVAFVGPDEGEMACGEFGPGRMAEPAAIFAAIAAMVTPAAAPLSGKRVLVTAGPTHEPIDPVRYIANRSSGKQGYAVAAALARLGADVVLVSGPTALAVPAGVTLVAVETAQQMLVASQAALPVDAAVLVAAVADWRPREAAQSKLKKAAGSGARLDLVESPDILATLSKPGLARPRLVVGFAAETEALEANARAKLGAKRCDWIVANDVSQPGVMGGDANEVKLVTAKGVEPWPAASKTEVAQRLAMRIAEALA